MSRPSTRSAIPEGLPPTPTSGLVPGLCVAMALCVALAALVLKRKRTRARRLGARTEPRQVWPMPECDNDTLPLEALALLPAPTHRRVSGGKTSDDDDAGRETQTCCSICTEPFMEGVELRVLPCGHQFDRCCVDPWLLRRSATCPLCRERITTRLSPHIDKMPRVPRPICFPLLRWKEYRRRTMTGPSLRSVPSVRSGGPGSGSGWAGRMVIVSCSSALPPIGEMDGEKTKGGVS